jgi:Flp pilus assembly protein protease CpaA
MRRFGAMIILGLSVAMASRAFAEPLALASCEKFTSAHDTKAALFDGYIYGFLAGRLGYGDVKRLTATAVKVRAAALDLCRKDQGASFVKVIDALSASAAKKSWLPKL